MSANQATAAVPVEATTSEQILSRLDGNNDQLNTCVIDLRSFVGRAVGATEPTGDTAAIPDQAGVLGNVSSKLVAQSSLLQELRELVLLIEKIA